MAQQCAATFIPMREAIRLTYQKFPVTFNASVRKSANSLTSTGTGDAIWDKAVDNIGHSIDFYRTLEDARPFVETASADCAACYGSGKVQAKRSRVMYRHITCPACRGKNSTYDVLPTLLVALNARESVATVSEKE